jgi:hypothetical protein
VEGVPLFGFKFGAIEMKDEEGRWVRRVRLESFEPGVVLGAM